MKKYISYLSFINLCKSLVGYRAWNFAAMNLFGIIDKYLAHVIEQPNLRIPNPKYLQLNFCFDFFNDSENTFWGFFEI